MGSSPEISQFVRGSSGKSGPVVEAAHCEYLFSFGPGLEFFADNKTSWRVEYIYRHMSNADEGDQNPGVDQGVFRVTLSLYR